VVQYYQIINFDHDIFFLLEFVKGETLHQAIRDIGILSFQEARFYTANILIILENLHQNLIIFRDVKPENFMIDDKVALSHPSLISLYISIKFLYKFGLKFSPFFLILGLLEGY